MGALTGAYFGHQAPRQLSVLADPLVKAGRETAIAAIVPETFAPQVGLSASLQIVALVAVDLDDMSSADVAAAFGSAFAHFLILRTPHANQRRLIALLALSARTALKALRRTGKETR